MIELYLQFSNKNVFICNADFIWNERIVVFKYSFIFVYLKLTPYNKHSITLVNPYFGPNFDILAKLSIECSISNSFHRNRRTLVTIVFSLFLCHTFYNRPVSPSTNNRVVETLRLHSPITPGCCIT